MFHALYEPFKVFLRLPVNVGKISVEPADCKKIGICNLSVLLQIIQMPLSPYAYGLFFFGGYSQTRYYIMPCPSYLSPSSSNNDFAIFYFLQIRYSLHIMVSVVLNIIFSFLLIWFHSWFTDKHKIVTFYFGKRRYKQGQIPLE